MIKIILMTITTSHQFVITVMRLDTYLEIATNLIMLALIDKMSPETSQVGTIKIPDQIIMVTFL